MLRRTGLQGNAMTYKKQLVTKAKLQLTAEYQSSTTALDSARASKSELLLVLVLVAAVLAVYLPVRQYPFSPSTITSTLPTIHTSRPG